ncbi:MULTISPECIES: threonine/serine exporter family protein [unclassified Romboutsia]|uniref:threonine/serine exporter family protein n=1 Tax=unclassified Romboutsia TaxID=2626894 RepID=UPI0008225BAF|nr:MULTISPECIES: threonine/serine exporter family protein [unclassified Romboutsia]SCI04822.1 Inner membrane protein YjjP [uncultured Clostridium sp.]
MLRVDEPHYKKNMLRLALFIGELMLSNGAETYRVEDTLKRICKSRGFNHINVFITPTVIIISDDRFDGYSFMKTINRRAINLGRIALINDFSRDFVKNTDMTIEDSMARLKEIASFNAYPTWLIYVFTGLGSASFAYLVGGNTTFDFVLTFLVSIVAAIVYDQLIKISYIPTFCCLISSILMAASGVMLTELGFLTTPKMLIVGSIMPLLPGVPFIKGVRDLIAGDLMSGVVRFFDATIIFISIAAGVGFVLEMWFRMGGAL